MAQARQRRAGERIEGAPARHAAVALQSVRMTVPVSMAAVAGGTSQMRLCHAFKQCDGGVLWRVATQPGDACLPLAAAQLGKLRDKTDLFGMLHGGLLFV